MKLPILTQILFAFALIAPAAFAGEPPLFVIQSRDEGGAVRSVFSPGETVQVDVKLTLPDKVAGQKFKMSVTAKLQIAGIDIPLNLTNALAGQNLIPSGDGEPHQSIGGINESRTFRIPSKAPSCTATVMAVITVKGVGKWSATHAITVLQ